MDIAREIRQAAARLWRSPGLSLGAAVAISVGLGGAVAIFQVVDAAVFVPWELQHADGVYVVSEQRTSGELFNGLSPNELDHLKVPSSPLESVAVVTTETATLTSPGDATAVRVGVASPTLFPMFRVVPRAGRLLRDDDALSQIGNVVVGEAFWNRHFVGRTLSDEQIVLDGRPVAVVGVLPAEFGFPRGVDIWRPAPPEYLVPSPIHYLNVLVKRRSAASDGSVNAFLEAVNARASATPGAEDVHRLIAMPFSEAALGTTRQTLIMLATAVIILLVLTASSVATLLVARTWGRRRDFRLKAALGATRTRLLREPLWESVLLAAPAAILCLVFARLAIRALHGLAPAQLPMLIGTSLDAPHSGDGSNRRRAPGV